MRVSMRAARVNAGLTQQQAASALGVGPKTLQYWESGVHSPRADKMPEICRLYGCELGDIIFCPKIAVKPQNAAE